MPGFGDIGGTLMIIGLAPASHGGLRTGRIFTGDSSSRFLVRALHSVGYASQPASESIGDGLVYDDCYLTAALKCAPPGDKPAPEEVSNCAPLLKEEILLMKNLKSVLVLGNLAFRAYVAFLSGSGVSAKGLSFAHGGVFHPEGSPALYASYHPSPRNTNTGRLTQGMLVSVLRRIRRDLA